jgi:NhaP-type Na+/H+ or K+/H+ antiporter
MYAGANQIQEESGLLAVTIMGIALASQKRVSMEQSLEFTEHVRMLLISTLFILLTARMDLSDITGLPIATLAFVAVVIFVARPASVLLSTVRSGLSVRERVFLSAMAPRGVVAAAVSSLFALELVETGY